MGVQVNCITYSFLPPIHLLHLDDDKDLHAAVPRDVTPENSNL